jgi:hypothetical protein
MKLIVTHINPDLDALSSIWLIRRYLPGFQGDDVGYAFVPAGTTYGSVPVDADPDVVHVDTGLGKYDHHQLPGKKSAFLQIYTQFLKLNYFPAYDIGALARMEKVITAYDNFQELYFADIQQDYHQFSLDSALSGLSHVKGITDEGKVNIALPLFDAVLQIMKNKMKAEKDITEGVVFETKAFGRSIFMENTNNDSMKFAQKSGFNLVARKDPEKGNIRIVCVPDEKYDLTPIYEEIKRRDKVGSWFFHQSRHMLLNGSLVNPTMIPSPLTSSQLLEILKTF